MNIPPCPVLAEPYELIIDQALIEKFQRAFRSTSSAVPPTVGAVALRGAFQIINEILKADWKKLLHVSQTFEYMKPLKTPMALQTTTVLKEIKTRAQMHFLNFEIVLTERQSATVVMTSKSTIIVRAS